MSNSVRMASVKYVHVITIQKDAEGIFGNKLATSEGALGLSASPSKEPTAVTCMDKPASDWPIKPITHTL